MELPFEIRSELDALASRLGISTFDLLLLADGSGTVYQQPATWSCLAYDRRKQQAHLHAGAVTAGTNNFAELFPFVHALWEHHQAHERMPVVPVQVHIISDSEMTVRCGNSVYQRRANGCLWAAVEWFERNGYQLRWHHIPRNSATLHAQMDAIASRVRRLLVEGISASTGQTVLPVT